MVNFESIKKTLKILSLIVATISAISFIQKVFDVGLIPIANDFISYYRKIAYIIFGLPAELIGISLPIQLIDFWTISFICAGAYVRSKNIETARAFENINFSKSPIKWKIAIFLVFGFTGIGLFIPQSILSINTYTENYAITREAIKNLFKILTAIATFFVINAFAPSM